MLEVVLLLGLGIGLIFAIVGGIFSGLTKAEDRRHKRWVQEKVIEIKAQQKTFEFMLPFFLPKEYKKSDE